jgi:hypothetical protein
MKFERGASIYKDRKVKLPFISSIDVLGKGKWLILDKFSVQLEVRAGNLCNYGGRKYNSP